MRRAIVLAMAMCLTACATAPSSRGVCSALSPVRAYTPERMSQAADELDRLGPDAALGEIAQESRETRAVIRAICGA
jgi:hypothetical protein